MRKAAVFLICSIFIFSGAVEARAQEKRGFFDRFFKKAGKEKKKKQPEPKIIIKEITEGAEDEAAEEAGIVMPPQLSPRPAGPPDIPEIPRAPSIPRPPSVTAPPSVSTIPEIHPPRLPARKEIPVVPRPPGIPTLPVRNETGKAALKEQETQQTQ
ncbi:MAG: hypothetical protein HY589_02045 [Candidatus Omnitrophica bacterium]|nr:hypothetical protein [Candidatus Omnitrophota bacterium]